ncbi:MAG: ATP-binding protein [Firmicutes bacterium]|nr:ATP-binding protein [Bacillota bacterium]
MIKRTLLKELQEHLGKKEITMLVGPRQAGKTTLMRILGEQLAAEGEKTLFLNLDFEEDKTYFESQLKLLAKIELELGKDKGFVFIDEIQRKENAGLFLKGLYDRNIACKLVVSGSGSIELKEKLHESLAGRKRIFELTTVNFFESVNYMTAYKYENSLSQYFEVEQEKSAILLEQYLNFGGYPRVVLENEIREKRQVIDEIYQSFVSRDIAALLKVVKLDAFTKLLSLLSAQSGSIVNHSELANTLGLSLPTVTNYLWYAEKTFVIQKLLPFFKNRRKEITKAPVYYFTDPGLRNYINGRFGALKNSDDFGFPFQAMVLNMVKELTRHSGAKINYWRTKGGAEVDLIIDYTQRQIPLEVKYRKMTKPEVSRAFLSFLNDYQPEAAVIVNLSLEEVKKIGKTTVYFLPYYKLPVHILFS